MIPEILKSPSWAHLYILFLAVLWSLSLLTKKQKTKTKNLPPGPPKLPILGNLHQLGKLPHRSLSKFSQKYGPVMLLQFGNTPALVVSSPETAKEVLKTHDLDCCSRPLSKGSNKLSYNLIDISFSPYDNYWREIRKVAILEVFSLKRVNHFQFIRDHEVETMIKKLSNLGIPEDSVNLSFQDLAQVQQKKIQQQHSLSLENKKSQSTLSNQIGSSSSSLNKLPSLDFNQSIEASRHHFNNDHIQYPIFNHHIPTENHQNLHHHGHRHVGNPSETHHDHRQVGDHMHGHSGHHDAEFGRHHGGVETSMAFSEMSGISMSSMVGGYNGKGRQRRPGIPHSNICTICSTYVYIFRHRCLVCGRVYCKQCLRNGMGEMTEGRKCIQCLGRRFSQRYIQKAGKMGCCMGYPNMVKKEELKWAEKGARRSGENRYGEQSTIRPRLQIHSAGNTPSFVMNSPHSPYSHTSFPMPL